MNSPILLKPNDYQNNQTSKLSVNSTPVHRRSSQNNQFVKHTQPTYIIQPTMERIAVSDLWGSVLSIAFNPDNLPTTCPSAIRHAWPILIQRMISVFPLIDPRYWIILFL